MYAVKVERTHQVRAIYQESKRGLEKAIEECEMRAWVANTPHIVTDAAGLRLHLSLPHEVAARRRARSERKGLGGGTWALLITAVLIAWAVYSRL